MHLASPASPVAGVVVANERCTAGRKAAGFVRHVSFDISGTVLAGSFLAGQSFGVLPPGVDERGKPHKLRLYSLASPSFGEDGSGAVVATTVKRLIDEHWESNRLFLGVASNYLCDLKPGDRVQLTGPSGKRFVLPARPREHDYVFVATGTGIAPFRGMIMDLLRAAPASRVVLLMGAAYGTDLLYHQWLEEGASRHPNLVYVPVLSRERQPDGAAPMYVHDRLATCEPALDVLRSSRGLVYLCGIAGMEIGVLKAIARLAPGAREQFVDADAATLAEIHGWTRQMLHKQVKVTRRVFMEVY